MEMQQCFTKYPNLYKMDKDEDLNEINSELSNKKD